MNCQNCNKQTTLTGCWPSSFYIRREFECPHCGEHMTRTDWFHMKWASVEMTIVADNFTDHSGIVDVS